MELRFIAPDLRKLDQAGTEVLVLSVCSDERPPGGACGLIDWRLSGSVAKLRKREYLTGELDEVLLIPGRPKLPFEKILLFGVGPNKAFDESVYRAVVERMLDTLEGLKAKTAVVELPGRHFDGVAPDRAVTLLLELTQDRPLHDVWTLIEPTAAQKQMVDQLVRERRRDK